MDGILKQNKAAPNGKMGRSSQASQIWNPELGRSLI